MKAWLRIDPTSVVNTAYRSIVTKTFVVPGGKKVTFDTYAAENLQHAAVIALTPNHDVIIARQFRPGPERVMEEIPGGTIDGQEDVEAAVRRELLEETGYQPGTLEYLGKTYKDGYMNAAWHYFLATDCIHTNKAQQLDNDELIDVHCISIEQLFKNARTAAMTDSEAVFLAYEHLQQIAQK